MAPVEGAPGRGGSGQPPERSRTKCDCCRQRKRKCHPSDRDWSKGEKCLPCEKGGLVCGPNVPSIESSLPHGSGQGSRPSPLSTPTAARPSSTTEFLQRTPPQNRPSTTHGRDFNVSPVSAGFPTHLSTASFAEATSASPTSTTKHGNSQNSPPLSERFAKLGLARIALENIRGVQRCIGPHMFTLEENKVQHDVKVTLDVMAYCVANEYHTIVEELKLLAKDTDTTRAKSIYFEILDDINSIDRDKEQFSEAKVHLLQELLLTYEAEGNLPAVERTLKNMSTLKHPTNSDSMGDVAAKLAHCFVIISTQIRDLLHSLHLPIRPPLHTDEGIQFPALHRALRGDLDDVARLLGQKPATLKERDILRQNAVIAAAATGKAVLLDPIFRNDPQLLTDRDILERPALFHAAHHGDFGSYLTLVDAGANIYHRDASSQSILGAAAAAGSTEIVRDLLDRGVPPNDDILHLLNPLHGAAKAGHHEVVRLLLDKGAWANYLLNGKTAAQLASENGFHPIADMIEEATSRAENNFYSRYPNSPANLQTAPPQRQTTPASRPIASTNSTSRSSPHSHTYSSPFIPSFASSQPNQHADRDYEVLNISQDSTPREPPRWTGVQAMPAATATTTTTTESVNDTYEVEEAY